MLEYDPYMPEVLDDPNALYARMRAEAPVYYVERFDAWALFAFEDIPTMPVTTLRRCRVPQP